MGSVGAIELPLPTQVRSVTVGVLSLRNPSSAIIYGPAKNGGALTEALCGNNALLQGSYCRNARDLECLCPPRALEASFEATLCLLSVN